MNFNVFLQDQSLWIPPSADVFGDSDVDGGYGYLSDKVKSYFNTHAHILDKRANRLIISGKTSKYPMRMTYDSDKTNPDDPANLTQDELDQLFNIVEAMTYYTVLDAAAMEAHLIGDNAAYGIYVPDSLEMSSTVSTSNFYEEDGATPASLPFHNFVAFSIAGASFSATFKVWITKSVFLENYPYSTIIEVLYPGEPAKLVNGNYSDIIDALTESTTYAFNLLNTPVESKDNSGVTLFSSEYFPTGSTNHGTVVFAVIYKGPEPSTQELREYIRSEIIAMNIVPQNIWEDVLPDLFVNGKYYIIPAWDHVKALPGVTLPQGIITADKIVALAKAVFPNIEQIDPGWIDEHVETLMSAGSSYQLVALPDHGNSNELLSLRGIHPTYQPIDATKPFFQYQEAHTKDFNVSLSGAMAILTGGMNLLQYTNDELDGRQYLTFVAGGVEYHVLKQVSYPSNI